MSASSELTQHSYYSLFISDLVLPCLLEVCLEAILVGGGLCQPGSVRIPIKIQGSVCQPGSLRIQIKDTRKIIHVLACQSQHLLLLLLLQKLDSEQRQGFSPLTKTIDLCCIPSQFLAYMHFDC